MVPRTRVDKLLTLRERAEDRALTALAQAHAEVQQAHERVDRAMDAARADHRATGRVELWVVGDDDHRRALQLLRAAEAEAARASTREAAACDGYGAARRSTEVVRRIQQRRRTELVTAALRGERRTIDEIAMIRFNASRQDP